MNNNNKCKHTYILESAFTTSYYSTYNWANNEKYIFKGYSKIGLKIYN